MNDHYHKKYSSQKVYYKNIFVERFLSHYEDKNDTMDAYLEISYPLWRFSSKEKIYQNNSSLHMLHVPDYLILFLFNNIVILFRCSMCNSDVSK